MTPAVDMELMLRTAFGEEAVVTHLRNRLAGRSFADNGPLIAALEVELAAMESDPAALRFDPPRLRRDLDAVKRRMAENADAYNPRTKPNPDAVFWPNPLRDPKSDLYEMLPVVRNLGLVTRRTPVGSAGSCFAMEIAYALQRRQFNFVVTEREADDIPAGVMMGGYDAANPWSRFPATWGLLFNTPSFRQLAERAFGVCTLPRLLVQAPGPGGRTLYADPYREGVFFASPEAYEANYERHVAATREALLTSRVFVITLGLNECWEFIPNGSVLSRNPRDKQFLSLVRPRVLTVAENVAHIQAFIDTVRAHNPDFTVIISVSPVPFLATTQGDRRHVITANGHSKAVLRIAAEQLVRNNRDTYYFPSYEQVTVGTREPWDADQRHVSREAVAGVMRLFDAMFVREDGPVQHPVQRVATEPCDTGPAAGKGARHEASRPVAPTIVLGGDGALGAGVAELIVDSIFAEPAVRRRVGEGLATIDPPPQTHGELLAAISAQLQAMLADRRALQFDPFAMRDALADYGRRLARNADVYNMAAKSNPDAVFWPNPKRPGSRSLFETLPYVQRLGLIGPDTPVGSAGSCFAIEIARELQDRGLNYVSAEDEAASVAAGVIMTGYDPQQRQTRFPASWGLMFNAPSFRQLAEKAFGERQLPRLLIPVRATSPEAPLVYSDPFREGVSFLSPEAFAADYDCHAAACRDALMRCKVFVVTLGLNECWEYMPAGAVLSRNPRERSLLPYLRPRILTVEENVADMQRFIDIVRAHNPDFTLIVSVSPVPLIATVRGAEQHIIAANGHSKAVLRAAAERLVERNRDSHYFPGYEMVTVATKDAWTADQRHPSRQAVERVMELCDVMFIQSAS